MIFRTAKDIKYGDRDAQRAYLNGVVIWERTHPTPPVEGDYVYFYYDAEPMPDPAFEWRTTTAQERSQGYVEWNNCYLPMYAPARSLYVVRVKIVDNAFSSQGFELQTLIPDNITDIPSEKYRGNQNIQCICGIASHPTTTLPPTKISNFGAYSFQYSSIKTVITNADNVTIGDNAFSELVNGVEVFDSNADYKSINIGNYGFNVIEGYVTLPNNALSAVNSIGNYGLSVLSARFEEGADVTLDTLTTGPFVGLRASDYSLKVTLNEKITSTSTYELFFGSSFKELTFNVNITTSAFYSNQAAYASAFKDCAIDELKLEGHITYFGALVRSAKSISVLDLTGLDGVAQFNRGIGAYNTNIPESLGIEEILVPAELLERYKQNWQQLEPYAASKLIGV